VNTSDVVAGLIVILLLAIFFAMRRNRLFASKYDRTIERIKASWRIFASKYGRTAREQGSEEEAERKLRELRGPIDEQSSQILDESIEEALKNDEIQEGVHKAGLTDHFLRASLKEQASRIWEAATSETEAYNSLERSYEAREQELRSPEVERLRQRTSSPQLQVLGTILAISALVVIGFLLLLTIGFLSQSPNSNYSSAGVSLGATAIVTALYVFLFIRLRRAIRVRKERLAEIEQREQEISTLRGRLRSAEQAVKKSVIEKGMLPELRSIINSQLEPSYDTALPVRDAPGLSEVFNPEYEIATEPKDRLYSLLSHMPGGSIGVAGPRGAGKTTLLGAFCRKESTTNLKGRPVLSVMIPAPVEYDAREFILHIFASVCQRALEIKGKVLASPWEDMEDAQGAPRTFLVGVVGLRETLAFFGLGIILIALSLFLEASVMGVNSDLVSGLGFFLAALGFLGLLIKVLHIQLHRDRDTRGDPGANRDEPLVRTARQHLQEIRFQQSYSSGWGGSLSIPFAQLTAEAREDAAVTLARHQLSLPEIMDHYRNFIELVHKEYEIIIGIDELDKIGSDEQVQRFLNEIKALFGLEGCFYLISVSESALSSFERRGLPIRDVFDSSFDAIVHVDYLDLGRAQQLLRRRVIGVPVPFLDFCHCMAGGLPRDLIRVFRDLFEDRRQAGTGADDLSTLCSFLVQSDLKSKLRAASIEARDITLEAEAKAGQVFSEIRRLEAALASPNHSSGRHMNLLEGYQKLLYIANQEDRQAEPSDVAAMRERMTSLTTELGVYLYYCATLLDFFGAESFDAQRLQQAESSGALDQLCGARQSFTISPSIAESVITDFRKVHSLDIPSVA
jgi:Cdc6-like AAA superfamily ATPase